MATAVITGSHPVLAGGEHLDAGLAGGQPLDVRAHGVTSAGGVPMRRRNAASSDSMASRPGADRRLVRRPRSARLAGPQERDNVAGAEVSAWRDRHGHQPRRGLRSWLRGVALVLRADDGAGRVRLGGLGHGSSFDWAGGGPDSGSQPDGGSCGIEREAPPVQLATPARQAEPGSSDPALRPFPVPVESPMMV